MKSNLLGSSDKSWIQRFWSKVNCLGDSDCWEWQGTILASGYGQFKLFRKKYRAHRLAYILNFECDLGSLLVLHHCDNRKCCNPNHLFLGTHKDNSEDRERKGRGVVGRHFPYKRVYRGDESKLTIYSSNTILEIRHRYQTEDISQSELARQFGMTSQNVGKIVRRDTWKHI